MKPMDRVRRARMFDLRQTGVFALATLLGLSTFSSLAAASPAAIAKFVAPVVTKAVASRMYSTSDCTKTTHYDAATSVFCGAFASFTGNDEKEWKADVSRALGEIQSGLAELRSALAAVERQQAQLLSQNRQILIRLDELVAETVAAAAITEIRTLWEDQFLQLTAAPEEIEAERLLRFARRIIDRDLDLRLGQIHDVVTRSQIGGKEPLLRLYARRLEERIRADERKHSGQPIDDLQLVYEFVENSMLQLLTEQRKGMVMYVWAAGLLEAECRVRGECAAFDALPHTARAYADLFQRHVEAQLDELNYAVDFIVLANSRPHATGPDFLHPMARVIFYQADLMTAASTNGEYGLFGRVIGMAESFGGELAVAGRSARPYREPNHVPTGKGRVDWWQKGSTGVYQTVRFAPAWIVYRFQFADMPVGKHRVDTSLPYHPQTVEVQTLDLATGRPGAGATGEASRRFGSFYGVARAGGGFAMLDGTWKAMPKTDKQETTRGTTTVSRNILWSGTNPPALGMLHTGKIEWNPGFEGEFVDLSIGFGVQRQEPIVFSEQEDVRLVADLEHVCEHAAPPEFCEWVIPHTGTTLTSELGYSNLTTSARVHLAASVGLGDDARCSIEVSDWSTSGSLQKKTETRQNCSLEIDPGSHLLSLESGAEVHLPTSGLDASYWMLFTSYSPTNIYLVPEGP